MMIEEELINYLNLNLKNTDEKNRNISIVSYYYGFGDSPWPTLEDTALLYGQMTRERIRQIINKKFRDNAKRDDFPSIKECFSILKEQKIWIETELLKRLQDAELITKGSSLRGILNLMQDLNVTNSYDIYSPELNKISRKNLDSYSEKFIFEEKSQNFFHSLLKLVNTLPGRIGIANLKFLKDKINDYEYCAPILKELIRATERSWVLEDGDDFWYLFEDRDNRLINFIEKTFATINASQIKTLSEVYRNAMTGRSEKYDYPPLGIIEKYLSSSRYLNIEDGIATFLGTTTELSDIELEVYEYLKKEKSVNFPTFKTYLISKNYGDAHINKVVTASPIIYVDRSKGRHHFEYSLVPEVIKNNKSDDLEDRYKSYLSRLRKIADSGTDSNVESKRRREQYILSEWLFDGKTECNCAICGESYHINSLVTAHKKKRSECNEAERLDPYIVMPLCVFGCDYLYESKAIYVEHGLIQLNNKKLIGKTEGNRAKELASKKIEDYWLQGSEGYFGKPD